MNIKVKTISICSSLCTLPLLAIAFIAVSLSSCWRDSEKTTEAETPVAEPDSMIYGLSCDGTNDSVIVFLPFIDGADPIVYHIEEAKAQGHVYGKLQIGDWVGIILNPKDSTEATMVINLDKLKGTWTYQVKPTWKDASKLTARAIRKNFAEMPDSLKEAYLVPREYGFTLKRSSVASPVGFVRNSSSLEDDSPVEYPQVKRYTGWKSRNGQLILISSDAPIITATADETNKNEKKKYKEYYDTLNYVFMNDDSLVLSTTSNEIISFHRRDNAISANAKAQKAAHTVANNKELK